MGILGLHLLKGLGQLGTTAAAFVAMEQGSCVLTFSGLSDLPQGCCSISILPSGISFEGTKSVPKGRKFLGLPASVGGLNNGTVLPCVRWYCPAGDI